MHEQPAAAQPDLRPPDLPESFGHLRARIASAFRPAVALIPDPSAGGRTQFGGQPHDVPGSRWPRSPARPMSFIGQIDLAEVRVGSLPRKGLLQLFYDVEEQKWGFDRSDRDWWRVVLVRETEGLVPVPVPAERFPSFERTTLLTQPFLSMPSPHDVFWTSESSDAGVDVDFWDAYRDLHDEWQANVFGTAGQAHQAGGYADWVHADGRAEAESLAGDATERASDWELVWQVASDDALGFMWGDLGYLYLMARTRTEPDAPGDLPPCHLTLQCS